MSHFRTLEISDSAYENDGLKFLTIKSQNLHGRGNVCLFVPENTQDFSRLPIYILLHGVYGSAWSWALKGGAHKTAKTLMENQDIAPAIIAMPSDGLWGDGSAYLRHNGKDFEKWIVSDVPRAINEVLSCTNSQSPICLAGLSMGGFGAFLLGVRNASKISAISAHSAITQFKDLSNYVEEPLASYDLEHKNLDVLESCIKYKNNLPPIRFDCGMEDPLLGANRHLHHELAKHKIPHVYEEFKGDHEWSYWKEHLKKTLLYFNHILK
ncbi:alpha/beta hydrolase [Eudoraea chungangensis]|uniref:alpha/beta hydrolase n=1 Tax=Eudoraea chungangensis TaxID=1481905 RepID=UPI0023EB548C|nr:alpha/beta hydrolase-fold protein [Eudoraea chungangensis]